MTDKQIEFSIAVLCYRSEEDIIPFVEKLHAFMLMFTFNWEIILVANYWPDTADRTPEIARQLSERLSSVRYIAKHKEGYMGWDMKCGLDACRGRYIGIIDGDGQFPMEAIFSCFAKIKSSDYDFVKTYRASRKDGIDRYIISKIYNLFFRILFRKYNGRDVNSKPKIFRREAYQKMELKSTDWFLDAEIVLEALRLGLKIYEIPVDFKSLSKRKSFVKGGALLEFTKNLIKYRMKYNTD